MLKLAALLVGERGALLQILSSSFFTIFFCFPSSITLSLLGKGATIQAVGDIYNGVSLRRERLIARGSTILWLKLMHVFIWQYFIALSLLAMFSVCFEFAQAILAIRFTHVLGGLLVLVLLSVLFCIGFAHVVIVGNLAGVVAVLEGGRGGFDCLVKAKAFLDGRKQTALLMALVSNTGMRLVEGLFEFRMRKGMNIWEGPVLVSMYSSIIVLETIMNVVFYCTCKTYNLGPIKV